MIKLKAKPRARASSTSRTNIKAKQTPSRALSSRNRQTKRDRVLKLLRGEGGTTIAAIVKVTGWQQHTVRGFLAGTVRKRLGLNLASEKTASGRIYRIVGSRSPLAGRSMAASEQPNG